jgi:fructose-bisphosphate aldolase class 1
MALRERLKEYYKLGARFTKWRGVYNISKNIQVNLQYILMLMH